MDKKEKCNLLHRLSNLGNIDKLEDILKDPEIKDFINRRSGTQKLTALHEACIEGQVEAVDALLEEESISVDPLDMRNWTPLCYAANKGYNEIARNLIRKGANVNHVLNNGDTPLHIAAMKSDLPICKTLLIKGADVDATNHNVWTPLHVAAGEGDADIVQLLIKYDAQVNKQTIYGDTASNLAARNDSEDILQLLKSKDADFILPNTNGEAPVHSAAMVGHTHTLKYLITNGADPMACAKNGMTISHFAAKNGHGEIFHMLKSILSDDCFKKLLMEPTESLKGMWISTIGCGIILSAVRPIHLASLEGHAAVVKLLIQYGANKDEPDGNKHTAKELVQQYRAQFQVWDLDMIDSVIEVLDNYTRCNTPGESAARLPPTTEEKHFDSDYYSTSSATTEDVESNMGDLEDCLKEFEHGKTSAKYVKKKRRALKKQIERSGLTDYEKDDIYSKLESIEKALEKLTSNAVAAPPKTSHVAIRSALSANKITNRFRANFTTLQRQLKANDHIHYLFEKGAIEIEDVEKVQSKQSNEDQVTALLYILYGKPDKNWTLPFVQSLEDNDETKYLAALLTE